jgi:hypothetical protein
MAREDELDSHSRRQLNEFDHAAAITVHKCVALDTLVETPRGLERIDEIAQHGEIGTHEGLRSYNSRVIYPSGDLWRIITKSGYTLDTTFNHGVYAWDRERGYERRTTQQLVPGDMIQFLLESVCDPKVLAALPASPPTNVRAKIYGLPTQVTADVAEWLGLMVADGTVYKGGFRLAKRHLDVVERFEWLCRSIFGVHAKRGQTLGTPHAEVNSTQIAAWCRQIGGLSPNQKAVPRAIRHSPLEIQARFLRGLFEDGTVNVKGEKLDHIEWSSCSETMAREVQIMLLRFGIVTSRRERDDQWLLYIYGIHAHYFRNRIGFVAAFKNQRLLLPTGKETRYRVPLTRAEIEGMSLTPFERQNARKAGHLSRDVAKRHSSDSVMLRDRLRYFHDEIISIDRLPDAPSACVSVPSLGRFLQNGSPQANSQGSQFEDVLLFDESQQFGKDARKHLYTGLTRSSKTLTVVV